MASSTTNNRVCKTSFSSIALGGGLLIGFAVVGRLLIKGQPRIVSFGSSLNKVDYKVHFMSADKINQQAYAQHNALAANLQKPASQFAQKSKPEMKVFGSSPKIKA